MAVSTTTRRISYAGNGSSLVFAYPFRILDAAHLKVYVNTVLQTSGYAVSGVGSGTGGSVTFAAPPANGAVILLLRDVPLTQTVDTQNNETILEDVLDTALDKLTMMVQQVSENVGRSPTLGPADVDGTGAYSANGNRIANLGAPQAQTDAARVQDINTFVAAAGNVPTPLVGDIGKVLEATGAGAFSWQSLTTADISGLAETVRDTIGAALVAGTNITITVNDAGDTITIANTGPTSADITAAVEANRAFRSQCAQMGPRDANGNPTFLPSTSGSLLITTQNISAANPLIIHAAQGRGGRTASLASNVTWTSLASSSTVYLGATIDAAGAATLFSTTTAPVYQRGGSPSTTNGVYTYIIGERTMYLGDGTNANKVYAVFLGEVVTSGSGVTSSAAYAYEGRYYSGLTAIGSAGTETFFNHNIGVGVDVDFSVRLRCNTNDGSYTAGFITRPVNSGAGDDHVPGTLRTRNQASVSWASTIRVPGVLGVGAVITVARWSWIFTADRGWD